MPVIFKCECGQEYISVPNKYIGKPFRCLVCQTLSAVPSPNDLEEKGKKEKNTHLSNPQ